ncbi:hypothetical protein [Priestia koreensis]|uniref:hypothetical protein n=1 Tax=Priestia koreensis TaxID=284581 RepID=UPI003017CB14
MNRPVFNKAEKQEDTFFIKMPSDLTHYVHLKDYHAEISYLYLIIVDFFNVKLGYAFPNIDQIAVKYGKSKETTRKHLAILKKYELIGVIDTEEKGHAYVPYVPLTSDEFYDKYTDAFNNYRDKLKRLHSDRVSARDRMKRFRDKQNDATV